MIGNNGEKRDVLFGIMICKKTYRRKILVRLLDMRRGGKWKVSAKLTAVPRTNRRKNPPSAINIHRGSKWKMSVKLTAVPHDK